MHHRRTGTIQQFTIPCPAESHCQFHSEIPNPDFKVSQIPSTEKYIEESDSPLYYIPVYTSHLLLDAPLSHELIPGENPGSVTGPQIPLAV